MSLQACDISSWQTAAQRDPSSTFFQTWAWHELSAPFCGGKPQALKTRIAGELVVLPLSCRSHFGIKRYLSPHGTYAAPLVALPLPLEERLRLSSEVGRLSIEWSGSPFAFSDLELPHPVPQVCHATSMPETADSKPESTWSKDMQRRLRRAEEVGITVHRVESDEDWNLYADLYRNTLKRWGQRTRRIYPQAFFQALRRRLSPAQGLDAFLAMAPGPSHRPIAGVLAFRHLTIGSAWQLVRGPHPDDTLGIPVVLRACMRSAYEHGCRLYDWGPSPDLPGVAQFKISLGGREYHYAGYRHQARLHRAAAKVWHWLESHITQSDAPIQPWPYRHAQPTTLHRAAA